VSGAVGRTSSFEVQVTVGDAATPTLMHSKLTTGAFPDFQALAKAIVDSAK
jgi:hypothetical protein